MRLCVLLTVLLGIALAWENIEKNENSKNLIKCNPDWENCALKEVFQITNNVERNFLIMGL